MALQASDVEALRERHQFVRDDDAAHPHAAKDWGERMARRYYDQLYKEFAILDLSRHEEGMVGMRWRTREEVLAGKGSSFCGAKRCDTAQGLATFEVPFQYHELGQDKMELVKVKLCAACAEKLSKYREVSAPQRKKRPRPVEPVEPSETTRSHRKLLEQHAKRRHKEGGKVKRSGGAKGTELLGET